MKRRTVFFAIIVIAAAALLVLFFSKGGESPGYITTSGIIEGVETNISTELPGTISYICCSEGDAVRQGDVVLRLVNNDLRSLVEQAKAGVEKAKADAMVLRSAIKSSRADIASAVADIKSAEADMKGASARMEEAKRQMDRASALYIREFISKESLDAAVTAYKTNVANYKSSKARLAASYSRKNAAEAQLNTAESRLNAAWAAVRQSEANLAYNLARLSYATIKSPLSGTVVFRALEKGETVSPGTAVLTIVNLKNLYARIDLEETRIGDIKLNGPAAVMTEDIPGRVFKGKISEIGRYAGFATQRDVSRGRQDIKTFRVKVALEDPGGLLKPGMTVEVEIPERIQSGSGKQGG
ncbi:putative multidrug resistance protein EmrK [bacterium BMS3Bbin06]|nr:putative multidrug resistance protein EmrK [bacterium BMS3Bbin06]